MRGRLDDREPRRRHGGDVQVLDSRSAEYRGDDKDQKAGRRGHIPSARSLEGYDLIDADGKFVAPAVQRDQLDEARIDPGKPVIAHAHGGGRSEVTTFALGRLGVSTRHDIRGFSDWAGDASLAVVTGAEIGLKSE